MVGSRRRLAVLAVLALGLVFGAPQAAVAASCFVDGHGAATDGSLCCNIEVYDVIAYINESDWTGNLAYNANRYDGNWTQTFHVYVPSGPYVYGTSGNAYRRTAIQRGGYSSMTSWYAIEYAIC